MEQPPSVWLPSGTAVVIIKCRLLVLPFKKISLTLLAIKVHMLETIKSVFPASLPTECSRRFNAKATNANLRVIIKEPLTVSNFFLL